METSTAAGGDQSPREEGSLTFESLHTRARQFAEDRDWLQFHTPRNLVLAFVGEVGELAELFQWRGECAPGLPDWSPKDRIHLGEELADCVIYLSRISDQCGIDLSAAVLRKLRLNALKYPVSKCKGKAGKYTQYDTAAGAASARGEVVNVDALEEKEPAEEGRTAWPSSPAVSPTRSLANAAAASSARSAHKSPGAARRAIDFGSAEAAATVEASDTQAEVGGDRWDVGPGGWFVLGAGFAIACHLATRWFQRN